MNVGFQHVAVSLGAEGFGLVFFFKDTPSRLGDHGIDLGEQFLIQMADIFRKGFVVKRLFLGPGQRRHAQDLAQESVMIGHILQPIIVAV